MRSISYILNNVKIIVRFLIYKPGIKVLRILELRGWNPDMHSDNYKLRQECLATCDLDIIGISETHLYDGQKIELSMFKTA